MIEAAFEVNVILEVRNREGEIIYRDERKALIKGDEVCMLES